MVQGFRVELDGVSAAVTSCEGVDSASVLLVNGELWGFYSPEHVSPREVREAVMKLQPPYAVPTHYKPLSRLPLTK